MHGGHLRDGPPLRRDAEANRRRILTAAERLISHEGLTVGHDKIAQAAGVAVGTVYRRFPDKSALVAALFTDQVDRVVAAAETASATEDPWQAIVDFLTEVMAMQAGNRGLRELLAGSPHGAELARHARRHIAPVVAGMVGRAHAAGVLRPGIAEADLALVPVMVGAVVQAAPRADPQLWQRALAIVLAGLRAGDSGALTNLPPSGEAITRILQGRD